jgi:hypothetical protein
MRNVGAVCLLAWTVSCHREHRAEMVDASPSAAPPVASADTFDAGLEALRIVPFVGGDAEDFTRAERSTFAGASCDRAWRVDRPYVFRTQGPRFELQIDLPREHSSQLQDALPGELARATVATFGSDATTAWRNCASCTAEYASEGFVSWRCEFDYVPAGVYPAYQIVGMNAVVDSTGVHFVDPLKACAAKSISRLIHRAEETLRRSGKQQTAIALLQAEGGLHPSAYRTPTEVAFSFTRDLPHVLQGEGVVTLSLTEVRAECGAASVAFRE